MINDNPIRFSTLIKPELSPLRLRKEMQREKILEIMLGILTFGIYTACRYLTYKKIVPLLFMPSILEEEDAPDIFRFGMLFKNLRNIKIQTLDGVEIDAASYEIEPQSKKWMVAFCPNGATYEETFFIQAEIANKIGVNLLLFNYRQVGRSQGTLTSSFKLALDGSAVIEYLKQSKGIQEKDMLFSGHSMGGGVASMLTKYYPQAALMSNRSYKKTSSVPSKFLKPFVKIMRLEIDALTPWLNLPHQRKLIIYHHRDKTIRYHEASLYYAVKETLKKKYPSHLSRKDPSKNQTQKMGLSDHLKPLRLKLKQGFGNEHSYSLQGKELEKLIKKIKLII